MGLRNIRFEELRASISRGRGERQRSDGSGIILRFCVAARSNFQTQAQGHFGVQRTTDMASGPVPLTLTSSQRTQVPLLQELFTTVPLCLIV